MSGFDEIGNNLAKAAAAFEMTKKKGTGSGQTIYVAVRDLLKLGVKPSGGRIDRRKKLQRQLVDAGVMDSDTETLELGVSDSAED